jgi:creatinine amidohydrolase/Fe(II)-dependent formamide hydrolase-like protein
MDVHAGVGETSAILAIRPALVRSDYKTPGRAGGTLDELQEIAKARSWQDISPLPRKRQRPYGRAIEEWWVDGFTELILRAVRGEDLRDRAG